MSVGTAIALAVAVLALAASVYYQIDLRRQWAEVRKAIRDQERGSDRA